MHATLGIGQCGDVMIFSKKTFNKINLELVMILGLNMGFNLSTAELLSFLMTRLIAHIIYLFSLLKTRLGRVLSSRTET